MKLYKEKVSSNTNNFSNSTRFFTHENIEKTTLFEGKNQSFARIIE